MRVGGIDPGLKGGIGVYDGESMMVYPTPVYTVEFLKKGKKTKRNEMDLIRVCEILKQHELDFVILEKVTARSGQGVTSMFRFGQNLGQHQAILTALQIPYLEVTPQVWKSYHGLIGSEKTSSLELAESTFPGHGKTFKLKKNDGLAEAALMAKYGYDIRTRLFDPSLDNSVEKSVPQ